jgi:hypothetical protein
MKPIGGSARRSSRIASRMCGGRPPHAFAMRSTAGGTSAAPVSCSNRKSGLAHWLEIAGRGFDPRILT